MNTDTIVPTTSTQQGGAPTLDAMLNKPSSSSSSWKVLMGNVNGMKLSQQQDSLLGMASSLIDDNLFRAALPTLPSVFQAPIDGPTSSDRPEDITSQVLAELSDDLFSDDLLADFEPLPVNPTRMNVVNPMPTAPAAVNNSKTKYAILEDTLNQVLNQEMDFQHQQRQPMPPMTASQAALLQQKEQLKRGASALPLVSPPTKKQRTAIPSADASPAAADGICGIEGGDDARRFRPYQAEQWTEKFDELVQFRQERGHCCVPHTFKENPALARWVKRQRYQYKLKNEGKQSTMTDERIVALEKIGFIWDSHGAAWFDRLNELADYRKLQGHCNVPSNYPKNPQLATWVKCQRRQYKLFWDGKTSNMTLARISELERLGFEWELRAHKSSSSGSTSPNTNVIRNTMVPQAWKI